MSALLHRDTYITPGAFEKYISHALEHLLGSPIWHRCYSSMLPCEPPEYSPCLNSTTCSGLHELTSVNRKVFQRVLVKDYRQLWHKEETDMVKNSSSREVSVDTYWRKPWADLHFQQEAHGDGPLLEAPDSVTQLMSELSAKNSDASRIIHICKQLHNLGYHTDGLRCSVYAEVLSKSFMASKRKAWPWPWADVLTDPAAQVHRSWPVFNVLPTTTRRRQQSIIDHAEVGFSRMCSITNVCVRGNNIELLTSEISKSINCLSEWTHHPDRIDAFGGSTVTFVQEDDNQHMEGLPHVQGLTLVYNHRVRCQLNLAVRSLLRLPRSLELAYPRQVSQILIDDNTEQETQFCEAVLGLISLSFPDFHLPTFHSSQAVRRGDTVCFDELMFVPQWHGYRNVRTLSDSRYIHELAYMRCKMDGSHVSQWVLKSERKLLVLDSDRAPFADKESLMAGIQDMPLWEVHWFEVSLQTAFCAQVAAVNWLSVILSRTGSHIEYVGFAARLGVVLIVVYAYPLLLQKFDVSRMIAGYGQSMTILDLAVLKEDAEGTKGSADAAMEALHGTHNLDAVCSFLDFVLIIYFPACHNFFHSKRVAVGLSTLHPYLHEAGEILGSAERDHERYYVHRPLQPCGPQSWTHGPFIPEQKQDKSIKAYSDVMLRMIVAQLMDTQFMNQQWESLIDGSWESEAHQGRVFKLTMAPTPQYWKTLIAEGEPMFYNLEDVTEVHAQIFHCSMAFCPLCA